ncbi:squalene/phytoene synthase family protein [Sphingomonas sp.]|uniref:squalene/phytoene synthase family protein n=1 Tax=Sphingomonas sp. TaxID=28214 RepID=UPI002B6ABD35|nr:squalene/phytoene synthase family protein [Sphingomonas sp.]HTG38123.1 squalene/phytoene synthase family protein [Sphingomonas sp.]
MVNAASTFAPGAEARAAERRLILSYAPADTRAGVAALFDLDATLADVLRQAREPMIAQMRLTWWHDALSRLDSAPPPAQPVLTALAGEVLAHGVAGAELARLVEGWEALLDGDPADPTARASFAHSHGGRLFRLAARRLAVDSALPDPAGQGWALADLSRSLSDPAAAAAAADEARALLDQALAVRWPRRLRVLGGFARQAAMDLAEPRDRPLPAATPGRIARLGWHRLTGR